MIPSWLGAAAFATALHKGIRGGPVVADGRRPGVYFVEVGWSAPRADLEPGSTLRSSGASIAGDFEVVRSGDRAVVVRQALTGRSGTVPRAALERMLHAGYVERS